VVKVGKIATALLGVLHGREEEEIKGAKGSSKKSNNNVTAGSRTVGCF
jgi:hypothetical protein